VRAAGDSDSTLLMWPRYLFSGLLTCGACGGGYTLVGARHYGCANTRNRGTCDNRLTIRRDVLEETVLRGLKDNLLQPELIHEFVSTYQQEYNRLRRTQANEHAAARAELASVERQIRNIVEAVKAGLFVPAMKTRWRRWRNAERGSSDRWAIRSRSRRCCIPASPRSTGARWRS
jgi:hypothetical protein